MLRLILVALFISVGSTSIAQKKAITETGEEVILNENGTWKYLNEGSAVKGDIRVNDQKFEKSGKATFLVKSVRTDAGVWIDPSKWSFTKGSNNADAEYQFQAKGQDAYGILIAERISIPLENLKKIAFANAQKAAPDIKITKEEYRTVNNNKILMMEMNGTIQGINFIYSSYYFSNAKGSIQLITFTAANLFGELSKEMEELLNGLTVQ